MADLTDADLDGMDRVLTDGGSLGPVWARRLLNQHRALRARVVGGTDGPDQGDPAAWLISDQRGPHSDSRPWATANAQEAERHRSHGCVVTPLRAPGAVSAAPPGDEDPFDSPPSAWDGTYDPLTGAPTVPDDDAPPAGHEDEAAVERAVRDLCAVRYFDGTAEGRGANMALDSILVALDVLAAARGPRTPDPGAGA